MKIKPNQFVKENYPVPERYNTVIKANALIQKSRFSLSTQQQKILLYIISQIEPTDDELKNYIFETTEYCRVCGIETQSDIYQIIREQIKDIADKSVWVELEDGRETLVRWIEKPYIDQNSGKIEIRFDRDMKPYLFQLKERYTQYELIYTLNFKSKYSIRLYEYLKSIHFNKRKPYTQTFEIDKFQSLLDSPYNNFKDFHTRVLKPAQKEINEHSDIIFSYELKSKGRKITEIDITIERKNSVDLLNTGAKNAQLLDKKKGSQNG